MTSLATILNDDDSKAGTERRGTVDPVLQTLFILGAQGKEVMLSKLWLLLSYLHTGAQTDVNASTKKQQVSL